MKQITTLALLLIGLKGVAQTPKFKQGDTVYNFKNKISYIIDATEWRYHSKQVFYVCHTANGEVCHWLPENSIKKAR